MAFISATASKVANGGGTGNGGYLTAGKLGDGESYRIAIVSESPLEYWTVWGESPEGQKKPFRFSAEPSAADIEAELGEFKQRMNYEGTATRSTEVRPFILRLRLRRRQDQSFRDHSENPDQGNRQALPG